MSVLDAIKPARVANTDFPVQVLTGAGTTYSNVVPPTVAGNLDAVVKLSAATVGALIDVWVETSIDGVDGWERENQLHRPASAGVYRLPCGHVDKFRRWGITLGGAAPSATLEIKTLHGGGQGQVIRSRRWYGVPAVNGGFIGIFATGGAKNLSFATYTNPGSVSPWLGIAVWAIPPDAVFNYAISGVTSVAAPTIASQWAQAATAQPVAHPHVRIYFASGATGAGNLHDVHAFACS